MQPNENVKPHFVDVINDPSLKPVEPVMGKKEKMPGKEKGWVEKLTTNVLDFGRDILTANQMAKDSFDGSSALMQAAKGATTTLIGVGLEKAMDEYFEAVMMGSEAVLNRTPVKFGNNFRKAIKSLEQTNSRIHHFIVQSAKDIVVGGAYNGLAFFSRPILESAKAEHLVGSLSMNATEAMFTKGLDYPRQAAEVQAKRKALDERDSAQELKLRELKHNDSVDTPAKRLEAIQERLKVFQERKLITDPTDKPLEWQTSLRKFTAYSNPATLLGLDMLGSSMQTFTKNLKDVRKVRKEKGGLAGKKVDMSQKNDWRSYGDRKPWENKREYGNKPPYNKDKVYYGRSRWQDNVKKQQEEEELAKSF